LKTFASAFVRQLFVEWPKLRAQIGANKTTDWAEMDLAVRNNWTYEQAVRESVSCLPACLVWFGLVYTQPKVLPTGPGKANPPGNSFDVLGSMSRTCALVAQKVPLFVRLGQDSVWSLPCFDLSNSGAPALEWVLGSDSYRCDCGC